MKYTTMKPKIFKVAFTFERGDQFHQGVMPNHDCSSHAAAEAYFAENYSEANGWRLDACWEA